MTVLMGLFVSVCASQFFMSSVQGWLFIEFLVFLTRKRNFLTKFFFDSKLRKKSICPLLVEIITASMSVLDVFLVMMDLFQTRYVNSTILMLP